MIRRLLPFLLVACGHSEPFRAPDPGTDQPFDPGPPARLTVNVGADGQPSFSPDGSRFIYSFDDWTNGTDRCLGVILTGRARVSQVLCPTVDAFSDDRMQQPALSTSGRVAYYLARQSPTGFGPYYEAVIASSLSDPRDTTEVRPIPFSTPDGVLHAQVERLAWVHGDSLAILTDGRIYLVDPDDPTHLFRTLPVPGFVTGMAPERTGDRLYVTLGGDSTAYSFALGSGGLAVIHDFTWAGIPTGFQVGGRRMIATAQAGLIDVDLADGTQELLNTLDLIVYDFALSPDGHRMVLEAVDTTVSPSADLYVLEQ